MASYYLLKVVRESLILAYGGADLKSYSTALQAGLLIIIVAIFTLFITATLNRKNVLF